MFQFIRAEVYARRASTNPKSKSAYNIDDIIGEALRDEGHCPHVEKPEPPRYLFGSEAGTRAILGRVKENALQYRDPVGRKMREDAAVLLAGVASFLLMRPIKTQNYIKNGNRSPSSISKRSTEIICARS